MGPFFSPWGALIFPSFTTETCLVVVYISMKSLEKIPQIGQMINLSLNDSCQTHFSSSPMDSVWFLTSFLKYPKPHAVLQLKPNWYWVKWFPQFLLMKPKIVVAFLWLYHITDSCWEWNPRFLSHTIFLLIRNYITKCLPSLVLIHRG